MSCFSSTTLHKSLVGASLQTTTYLGVLKFCVKLYQEQTRLTVSIITVYSMCLPTDRVLYNYSQMHERKHIGCMHVLFQLSTVYNILSLYSGFLKYIRPPRYIPAIWFGTDCYNYSYMYSTKLTLKCGRALAIPYTYIGHYCMAGSKLQVFNTRLDIKFQVWFGRLLKQIKQSAESFVILETEPQNE